MPTIVNGKSTIPADAVHSIKKNTVALKGQSSQPPPRLASPSGVIIAPILTSLYRRPSYLRTPRHSRCVHNPVLRRQPTELFLFSLG